MKASRMSFCDQASTLLLIPRPHQTSIRKARFLKQTKIPLPILSIIGSNRVVKACICRNHWWKANNKCQIWSSHRGKNRDIFSLQCNRLSKWLTFLRDKNSGPCRIFSIQNCTNSLEHIISIDHEPFWSISAQNEIFSEYVFWEILMTWLVILWDKIEYTWHIVSSYKWKSGWHFIVAPLTYSWFCYQFNINKTEYQKLVDHVNYVE